jgi:hypothetical protein
MILTDCEEFEQFEIVHETVQSRLIKINNEKHWIPKSISRIVNGRLFIIKWLVNKLELI